MVFAFSRAGKNNVIALIETDKSLTKTIGEYKIIFDGDVIAHTSEWPKIYYKHGYYYVLFPSGGVATGWQSVCHMNTELLCIRGICMLMR